MEQRFWQTQWGLYADEADANWRLTDYRGQNANMHACEAMLAAYEATQDTRFLHRAELLAKNVVQRQTVLTKDLVWEHFKPNWEPDWDYNLGDNQNLFRPWGFQPGHLTEWAKLILILNSYRPQAWALERAQALYAAAFLYAWDEENGGLHYGFSPNGQVCLPQKYHWVQCETLAAAARLAAVTGNSAYWRDYDKLWRYCWQHFVDHQHGAWFRILDTDNSKITDEKSPASKVDYHNMGACHDILDSTQ